MTAWSRVEHLDRTDGVLLALRLAFWWATWLGFDVLRRGNRDAMTGPIARTQASFGWA